MVDNIYPSLECSKCDSDVIPTWPETESGELKDENLRLECSCLEVRIGESGTSVPNQWRRSPDGKETKLRR